MGNSTFHGARPVHLIIKMIKWIRTSIFSIKNSLFSTREVCAPDVMMERDVANPLRMLSAYLTQCL